VPEWEVWLNRLQIPIQRGRVPPTGFAYSHNRHFYIHITQARRQPTASTIFLNRSSFPQRVSGCHASCGVSPSRRSHCRLRPHTRWPDRVHGGFAKMGIHKLRFKPAYNPYTEPSMEILAFMKGWTSGWRLVIAGCSDQRCLSRWGYRKI
jgi:hypothetical protein